MVLDIIGDSLYPLSNVNDSDGTYHGDQVMNLNGKRPLDSDDVVVESEPEDELTQFTQSTPKEKGEPFYLDKQSKKRCSSKDIQDTPAKSNPNVDYRSLVYEHRTTEHHALMDVYELDRQASAAKLLYWQTKYEREFGTPNPQIVLEINQRNARAMKKCIKTRLLTFVRIRYILLLL